MARRDFVLNAALFAESNLGGGQEAYLSRHFRTLANSRQSFARSLSFSARLSLSLSLSLSPQANNEIRALLKTVTLKLPCPRPRPPAPPGSLSLYVRSV